MDAASQRHQTDAVNFGKSTVVKNNIKRIFDDITKIQKSSLSTVVMEDSSFGNNKSLVYKNKSNTHGMSEVDKFIIQNTHENKNNVKLLKKNSKTKYDSEICHYKP